jgi:TonB family protein
MVANSEHWEGQVVNGKFSLGRALGSDRSPVFLVEGGAGVPAQTIIRFVDATSADAHDQLKLWEAASKLSHPNLIRIFETGRCQIAGHDLFYVLTEHAEEDLAQILPERALTAEEARQVLESVLAALAYIHEQGIVHGSLKPSNIFAVGDTVKVSSDTLRAAGQSLVGTSTNSPYDAPETSVGTLGPSADVWALGAMLVAVLTQHPPAVGSPREQPAVPQGIPQPFREIVENCLKVDPARRWSVAQIKDHLRGKKVEADRPRPVTIPAASQVTPRPSSSIPGKKQSAKWPYAIAVVVAIVLVVLFIPRPRPPLPEPAAESATESSPPAGTPGSSGAATATSSSSVVRPARSAGQVAERVMPQLAHSALRSIQGRIRIQAILSVDNTGNVSEAHLKMSGPSPYFARQSLEAVKRWKFRPPMENGQPVASEWQVQFILTRRAIDDSARQIKP